jgi:hypothetical protein
MVLIYWSTALIIMKLVPPIIATLSNLMDASHTIRESVAKVAEIRQAAAANPDLLEANMAIKRFQAQRFEGTYRDLLRSPIFTGAAKFFLDELYGAKDYSLRDAQFARIASALQTFFPKKVISTAVALAQLHALTEELDQQMALAWLRLPNSSNAQRYMQAWKTVSRADDRNRQLQDVLQVGVELDKLTRTPGLRTMLRMMRKPAEVAGLGALQSFLESGFDTFAGMAKNGSSVSEFLETIRQRETEWFILLYGHNIGLCELKLRESLSYAS